MNGTASEATCNAPRRVGHPCPPASPSRADRRPTVVVRTSHPVMTRVRLNRIWWTPRQVARDEQAHAPTNEPGRTPPRRPGADTTTSRPSRWGSNLRTTNRKGDGCHRPGQHSPPSGHQASTPSASRPSGPARRSEQVGGARASPRGDTAHFRDGTAANPRKSLRRRTRPAVRWADQMIKHKYPRQAASLDALCGASIPHVHVRDQGQPP